MPDVRLIDATRLHAQVFNDNGGDISKTENVAQILLRIENAPTIDAQPVKHGRWIPMDEYHAKCSVCGWWQRTNGKCCTGHANIHKAVYKYCTACGSKMDGDSDADS